MPHSVRLLSLLACVSAAPTELKDTAASLTAPDPTALLDMQKSWGRAEHIDANVELWFSSSCTCAVDKQVTDTAAITDGVEAFSWMSLSYTLEVPATIALASTTNQGLIYNMGGTSAITSVNGATTGGFGYLATLNGKPILAFAGTNFLDIRDVEADLRSVITDPITLGGKDYNAGSGFIGQYTEIMASGMRAALDTLFASSTDKHIYVAGHSLGGALANIAAVDLVRTYGAKVILHTAGAPRTFSSSDANEIQADYVAPHSTKAKLRDWPSSAGINAHRWINYGDPIPLFTPESAGFQHYGNGLYIVIPRRCTFSSCPMEVSVETQDYTPGQLSTNVGTNHLLTAYKSRAGEAIEEM